jgi:prevent-host-death family protein
MTAARARLSEVVRQAQEAGPQRITVRGQDAAVVLSPEDHDRLTRPPGAENWAERLRAAVRAGKDDDMDIEFERNPDTGRDFDL